MSRLFGTQIFWTTVVAVPLLLAAMTLVGRLWSSTFPMEYRQSARLYLSPGLGLASFVLIASVLGSHLPLGDTIVVPLVLLFVSIAVPRLDPSRSELVRHLIIVGLFGLLCGTSVLAPLYVSGAINAHNDTFTYLAHGDWLQQHAFAAQIPADKVTPAATQVLMYQLNGFRMGASFLLAFFQAVLNIRWSYEIYPAVVITAMAACCLAIGFPIAELLGRLRWRVRLALLALPSFSLGGLVFGANQGFLPQTIGLTMAAAAIFATGAALTGISSERRGVGSIVAAALPVAVLLAAAIFSYSEIAPFLVAAIGLSGLFCAIWSGAWRNVCIFGCVVALLTVMLTNFELLRTYHSLRTQVGAVVGSPVDWSLLRFVAHAAGIQAGAWDNPNFTYFGIGWGLILAVVVVSNFRSISWGSTGSVGSLLIPVLVLLLSFFCGLIYFRYVAVSPFPVGRGQSWSQFKLMEWAHPFVTVLVLAILVNFLTHSRKSYRRFVLVLLAAAALGSCYVGILRTRDMMRQYENVADVDAFYKNFREAVFTNCPRKASIYLALGGSDHKFRQLVSTFLTDRALKGDWSDDGYAAPYMPPDQLHSSLVEGDCLVEPSHRTVSSMPAMVIGPVRIGIFDGSYKLPITSAEGAFEEESDGPNSWRWIEREVTFSFMPLYDADRSKMTLRFEYVMRMDQPLQLEVMDGFKKTPLLVEISPLEREGTFSRDIDIGRVQDLKVSISSRAEAEPLSDGDRRKAAFQIKNLSVSAVLN
jgi:hypothetical protein